MRGQLARTLSSCRCRDCASSVALVSCKQAQMRARDLGSGPLAAHRTTRSRWRLRHTKGGAWLAMHKQERSMACGSVLELLRRTDEGSSACERHLTRRWATPLMSDRNNNLRTRRVRASGGARAFVLRTSKPPASEVARSASKRASGRASKRGLPAHAEAGGRRSGACQHDVGRERQWVARGGAKGRATAWRRAHSSHSTVCSAHRHADERERFTCEAVR